MNSPTDEQRRRVRYKIAEVLGWKFHPKIPNIALSYNSWTNPNGKSIPGDTDVLPDWPGSLDVSRGLEIEDTKRFVDCLATALGYNVPPMDRGAFLPGVVFYTAYQWCLAWLLYLGWCWEICENPDCSGSGVVPVTTYDDNGDPIHGADHCPACNGEGGRWEKC